MEAEFVSINCPPGAAQTSWVDPKPTRSTQTQTGSLWSHNQSTMQMTLDGADWVFAYYEVRPSLRGTINVGDILLRITKRPTDSWVNGRIAQFSAKCGKIIFDVSGQISFDQRTITLKGQRPIRDGRCNIVRHQQEQFVFEFLKAP